MSSPLIWAGAFAKFLKSQLNLGDQVYILNGTVDPTSVATLAPAGSIYMLNVAGSANVYLKNDAGSTTNWTLLASGISLTAVSLDTAMRDEFDSSVYQFMNKNILGLSGSSQLSSFTGTAAYDSVAKQVNFGATLGSQVVSTQQLDTVEFLGQSSVITDITQVDLTVFWATGSVDTGATYEVSRDGGLNFQTVTMQNAGTSTEVFGGSLSFTTESSMTTFANHTTGAALEVLSSGVTKFAEQFIVPAGAGWVIQQFLINVSAASASPGSRAGNIYFQIVKSSGSTPSTAATDVLSTSAAYSATGFATGLNTITIPNTVLPAGTYWIQWYGDTAYYTGGNLVFIADFAGGGNAASFNGTTWTLFGGADFKSQINGRPLDLRVRVTSSQANKKINGWAVSYRQSFGVVTSTNKQQTFSFTSTGGDPTLTLTQFTPDPNLMRVYHKETGLTYLFGIWTLQGTSIVFPTGFFNPDNISRTVTLVADQNTGGSFDNSDNNALLLAANALGSTNPTIDRSVAGHGPILRRPDGTLRMLALDNSDNLTISSVP